MLQRLIDRYDGCGLCSRVSVSFDSLFLFPDKTVHAKLHQARNDNDSDLRRIGDKISGPDW